MLNCPVCKVNVAGNKARCPLCGGALSGTADPETEVFPVLSGPRLSVRFYLNALGLFLIAANIICLLINIATFQTAWWSLLVMAGSGCAWVTAAVAVAHRRDLTQSVAWQLTLLSGLSLIWDWRYGFHGWSIDFVLPCAAAAAVITIVLLILLLRLPLRACSSPLIYCALVGLVPGLLVILGKVKTPLPSLICAGLSIVVLCALILFFWNTVKSELHRRFHL
jgi:hypothetical protein